MFSLRMFKVIALSAAVTAIASATTFSAVGDFSNVINPNGVWSYGSEATLGGTFTTIATPGTCGSLKGWETGGNNVPWVLGNPTGSTANCGTGQDPTNLLDLHPGANSVFSVVRFTAPTAGSYALSGFFQGIDPAPTTTDVHVLVNGIAIFNGNIASFGTPSNFSGSPTLAVGDKVDFAVGVGTDGAVPSDSTGLSATLISNAVPEPGTLTLLGMGVALMAWSRRRS